MAFQIKLAICDDEPIYRESIEAACKAFFAGKGKKSFTADAIIDSSEDISTDISTDISMDISIFSSGKELIASDKDFDILLLDIEMPDLDGISVKDYFITHRKQTRIIFMTSHQERAIEAFGKNVVRFLVKPLKRKEFWRVLEETFSDICGEVLEIEENGTTLCLPVKQIQYIEAQDKYTTAVTLTGDYLVRKTMKFWEKELPEQDFCRIHKSYLPILKEYCATNNGIGTYYLDIKKYREASIKDDATQEDIQMYESIREQYNIKWVPTLLHIRNGIEVARYEYLDAEYGQLDEKEKDNRKDEFVQEFYNWIEKETMIY